MKRSRIVAFLSGLLIVLVLTLSFKGFAPAPANAQASTILVSAAASLQDAIEVIDPIFERANRGTTVNYNFGSSGALQQQIEQGAPADVFISAGVPQMDALAQAGLIDTDTRRNLLTNRLVLIVPKDSTLNLTGFRQLTGDRVRRISVGEFRSVPAGQYAEQVLTNLRILEQVRPKLVFANNVRAVLAAVESGNVDAGIVYRTDALISDQVTQVATAPNNLHNPIVYPIAVVESSRNPQAARTYEQFLSSRQAQAVFERFGFGIAN
ncbi:MAG: molybdate ABC transporter substrate-binding protein [Microcoleus sp. SIO2G3]|nr:molybdate ABC transporter substrate-binding protein [Microcoleus sp. SIO2G3]